MGLVKKTDYNAKITEIESKISSISSLAANFALTAVENKIPDVSSLVKKKKKNDHDYDKYITTSESNNLTAKKNCWKISTSIVSNKD